MRSSATTLRTTTSNLRRSSAFATAGPERSAFSPREQESLTVNTAARVPATFKASRVEKDIFTLGRCVALRLVEQPQALHQQPLRIQGCRFLPRLPVEIHLKISVGPTQHFENRLVPCRRTIHGVLGLPLAEINFAFFVAVGRRQQ